LDGRFVKMETGTMGYSVRKGKLVKQEKPKWEYVPVEPTDDPEYTWLKIVGAKMAEMFGPPEDEEWGWTREQEKAAEAALAQEGKYPPAHPCPLM
jgi:hypothetical protein